MRQIYYLLAVSFLVSCSKSDQMVATSNASQVNMTKVIDAAVVGGVEYQLPVSSSNMKVYKQASYFEVSSVGVDAKTGITVYRYLPAKGFTGTDEVTLSDSKTSLNNDNVSGCRHNSSSMGSQMVTTTTTFVKIRFTVSN